MLEKTFKLDTVSQNDSRKQKEWDAILAFKAYLVYGPDKNRRVFDRYYKLLKRELKTTNSTIVPTPEQAIELLAHHIFMFKVIKLMFNEHVLENNRLTRLLNLTVEKLKENGTKNKTKEKAEVLP